MARIKMEKASDLTIKEAFENFKKHCIVQGCVEDTVKYYQNTINTFGHFYDLDSPVSTITQDVVENYQVYLSKKNLASKTVKTYVTGLRTILYYFMDEEYIDRFKIQAPKCDEQIKELYTKEDFEQLLKKPNMKKCSFAQYRNWVMVMYFIGTGQRLNSVIHIKIRDVNLSDGVVLLNRMKGRKGVMLPLSETIVKVLKEYLTIRKGNDNDYLFCNQDGGPMTRSSAYAAIRNYNLKRGIDKTSIHLFRHSFAKEYLQNGGNVFHLKKLMSHSDLHSTEKYLNLVLGDVKKNYEELNPLERTMRSKITMKRGRA